MLKIDPARVSFSEEGVPYAQAYQDHYFSIAGGAEETKYVFIEGNDLEARWRNRPSFCIGETGFGTGLNFFLSCQAWLEQSDKSSILHYFSVEKHPLRIEDLISTHQDNIAIQPYLAALTQKYPLPIAGYHRIALFDGRVELTLALGDANDILPDYDCSMDAWYLDGFAPARNPTIWTRDALGHVYRLTKPGGTYATYAAAGELKRNLRSVGFDVRTRKGFGHKREMLYGDKPNTHSSTVGFALEEKSWLKVAKKPIKPARVAIVGAGLAGCIIAEHFARRNWKVCLYDKHSSAAQEASGNPTAILMPRLSLDHDAQSQLTLQGYAHSLSYFQDLHARGIQFPWASCGVVQIARDEKQRQRMLDFQNREVLDARFMQRVTQSEASRLVGTSVCEGGWYFPQGSWVAPGVLCESILEFYAEAIRCCFNTTVCALQRDIETGVWQLLDAQQNTLGEAEVVILANALNACSLAQADWCAVLPKRGQITQVPATALQADVQKIVCSDVYMTPSIRGDHSVGASFVTGDQGIDERASEHQENLDKITRLFTEIDMPDVAEVMGRAGVRAVGPDRMPLLGPVANESFFLHQFAGLRHGNRLQEYPLPDSQEGLFIASGFGSRGLAWIPLAAQALVNMVHAEPLPFGQKIMRAIHPNRLLAKNLYRETG